MHFIWFEHLKEKHNICLRLLLVFISYELWFLVTVVLESFWFCLRVEFIVIVNDMSEDRNERVNRILTIPYVLGMLVLLYYKFKSVFLIFDKYALNDALYVTFTVHLANFFFSIPAVVIN